jgi:hypothetical protein
MHEYWEQLKSDNGNGGWVSRLAQADIYPFIISGSGLYDCGLIDYNIVYLLSGWGSDTSLK